MPCSNHHPNFSRKPRISVRQVWKRKTSTPKSSHSSQKDSPPLPSRVNFQSPSPPSYNSLRDQTINQLHNISTILDSHTNPSNAYIHVPPPQPIHPPSHAQAKYSLALQANYTYLEAKYTLALQANYTYLLRRSIRLCEGEQYHGKLGELYHSAGELYVSCWANNTTLLGEIYT
ncbi:hypothetical protein Tco_0580618 [Tanacetum coccineum]